MMDPRKPIITPPEDERARGRARDQKDHVMTPEEMQAQRESYARSMEPCEHGVHDWETCVGCRKNSVVKGN